MIPQRLSRLTRGWASYLLRGLRGQSMYVRSVESDSLRPHELYVHGILLARILEWVACLLQGIFPTWGRNPALPHCRRILCQLSHREAQEYCSGQPIPSPRDLPDPGIKLGSPALQADSLPTELPGKPKRPMGSFKMRK